MDILAQQFPPTDLQKYSMPSNKATNAMFADGFTERHDLEQYFWTKSTVDRLMKALEFTGDCCCLTTPTLVNLLF